MNRTLLINLYGGPCTGKSTICAAIFYELKKRGIECEMALEYAKEKVWENSKSVLNDQLYVFAKQFHRIYCLNTKVDVIITDSPLPLCIAYNKEQSCNFNNLVIEKLNLFNHVDYVINRKLESFNDNGRIHNMQQSLNIDNKIVEILDKYHIAYQMVDQDKAVEEIVNKVLNLNTI